MAEKGIKKLITRKNIMKLVMLIAGIVLILTSIVPFLYF